MSMVYCENLVKIYKAFDLEVVALQGLDLVVESGELMGIIGSSGSGKSSLLNIIGGLDRPSAGTCRIDEQDILAFDERQLRDFRRTTVGFVWQNSGRNLIPYLTAQKNVELPMRLDGKADSARALELLDMVGLRERRNSVLGELSGGEQQRVAIAIGLANRPKMLLADEPTGAVDTQTTKLIMNVFQRVNRELGTTIVIVTHDRELARQVSRVVAIRDGRTSSEILRKEATAAGDSTPSAVAADGHDTEPAEHTEHAEHADNWHTGDDHQEELVVMDRVGRIQLPHHCVAELGLTRHSKLRIELRGREIVVSPRD